MALTDAPERAPESAYYGGKNCIQLPSTYVAGYWESRVPHGRRFDHSRDGDIIQRLFGAECNQPWSWVFAHTTFGYKQRRSFTLSRLVATTIALGRTSSTPQMPR